jgi:hypothetical protein
MDKKKAPIVCTSCRSLKKKCDGRTPCSRCVEKCMSDTCELVVPKKRGRRSREELAAAAATSSVSPPASHALVLTTPNAGASTVTPGISGFVDMLLPQNQARGVCELTSCCSKFFPQRCVWK